jgi:IS5 family transposase
MPSIPPGVFFRMTFVGYFEGLPSHRSIAWRCADSRSLAEFLGLGPADETPDHSSISKTHKRLPKEVFDEVFRFILRVAARKGLLWGEKLGIDSTTMQAAEFGMKAYIPERASPARRRWVGKDPSEKKVVHAARRRTKSEHGKLLSRIRSELVERSFAHVCDTGGARRTWLRGLQGVTKRHLMVAAARNLSTIMRVICGIGSPRALQGLCALLQPAWTHFGRLISALENLLDRSVAYGAATVRSTLAA